ncbi:MAG TPA: DUF3276 family protein [Treponema sp.]|nr:DUF3276 family protein [Treponema sp.]
MGIRGELFTTEVILDNRTYFFNIKENRMGDVFLQVVESKSAEGSGFDRHAIVVFEEDMQRFLGGLESSLQYIEKTRKTRQKTSPETKGKKIVRRRASPTESESVNPHDKTPPPKPGRRVKVIPKKK